VKCKRINTFRIVFDTLFSAIGENRMFYHFIFPYYSSAKVKNNFCVLVIFFEKNKIRLGKNERITSSDCPTYSFIVTKK